MQAKNVKELHSNFVNFSKCDGDIKYMTLTDLLSLLKKNELEQSVLEEDTQRLVISNVYDCICGDNGELQDLSIQCLPFMTIQFAVEEVLSLSLKFCQHLQRDLPPKKDDEERYNKLLRQSRIITSSLRSMCTSNTLLLELSQQNKIPTPHLMSSSVGSSVGAGGGGGGRPLTDSPLLLPNTAFSGPPLNPIDDDSKSAATGSTSNDVSNENISRLIESLSSLLLNIIAAKQQSMRIEVTKHCAKQQQQSSIPNELIVDLEHFHEPILLALDVLSAIIEQHGKRVSFIFDTATNVLLQLLSGANHQYSGDNQSANALDAATSTVKALMESNKVNRKAIECLGSLCRFLPNPELKVILETLCQTMRKCREHEQYSTLKNLFGAVSKISDDQRDSSEDDLSSSQSTARSKRSSRRRKGLSFDNVSTLCVVVMELITGQSVTEQIEIREHGLMAMETLIKNATSSSIIALFPRILPIVAEGLRYDPNWTSLVAPPSKPTKPTNSTNPVDDDGDNEMEEVEDDEEPEATGWSDDDDSWGNDDDDDNDNGDAADHKEDGNYEYGIGLDGSYGIEELQELNQNLDDDGDSSWKVRRASNKCIAAMIGVLEETARDFNPNMFRIVVEGLVQQMMVLLVERCSERVLRIQLGVFETLNALLVHLNHIQQDPTRFISVQHGAQHGDLMESVCQQIARKEYIVEVLHNDDLTKPSQPAIYGSFFESVTNILTLYQYTMTTAKSISKSNGKSDGKSNGKLPECIPTVLPLCLSAMTQYKDEKWNDAIAAAFKCCVAICGMIIPFDSSLNSMDNAVKSTMDQIFSLNADIAAHSTSNPVLEAMYHCITVLCKSQSSDARNAAVVQCLERLKRPQQQRNVMNAAASCLAALIALDQRDSDSGDLLRESLVIADQLISNEPTRLSGIELSVCCMERMDGQNGQNGKNEQNAANGVNQKLKKSQKSKGPTGSSTDTITSCLQPIVENLALFLKQNSLSVRSFALRGLVLALHKWPELSNTFPLTLSDIMTVLKSVFDYSSSSAVMESSYIRCRHFLSVLICLFGPQCTVYHDDVDSVVHHLLVPLTEAVTHCNTIHPSLFPLWRDLFAAIGRTVHSMNTDSVRLWMTAVHNKLVQCNEAQSTTEANQSVFHSSCCVAAFFNQWIECEAVTPFLIGFVDDEKRDEDEDIDMVSNTVSNAASNSQTMSMMKEINIIMLCQMVSMHKVSENNPILDRYRKFVADSYGQCLSTKEQIASDGMTHISSCYLQSFGDDLTRFMEIVTELMSIQPRFALKTLSKVIESADWMPALKGLSGGLLTGDPLEKLLTMIGEVGDQCFVESATVVSHLLCHEVSRKETIVVISEWLKQSQSARLAMESVTAALITCAGTSNHSLSELIVPEFVENVVSLIGDETLSVSSSALKAMKFLILSRIKEAVQRETLCKVLLVLLQRTKSSADYMEEIKLGPITKMVDKSAAVRSLAFEVITDIVEYDNGLMLEGNGQFMPLFMEQLTDGLQSEDAGLINAQCQCFEMLLRSGLVTTEHITERLVRCIGGEIEKCKEGDGARDKAMDSTKKEKLGYLLQIFSSLRKGVASVATLDYVHEVWTSTSSLMNQIEVNPAFLTRTPSMIYAENMDIGQPLLLSPSLRSHSISSLQRQNSLQNLQPLSPAANHNIHSNFAFDRRSSGARSAEMVDVD